MRPESPSRRPSPPVPLQIATLWHSQSEKAKDPEAGVPWEGGEVPWLPPPPRCHRCSDEEGTARVSQRGPWISAVCFSRMADQQKLVAFANHGKSCHATLNSFLGFFLHLLPLIPLISYPSLHLHHNGSLTGIPTLIVRGRRETKEPDRPGSGTHPPRYAIACTW